VPRSTNSSTDHLRSAMKQSSSRPTTPSPQSTILAANAMSASTSSSTITTATATPMNFPQSPSQSPSVRPQTASSTHSYASLSLSPPTVSASGATAQSPSLRLHSSFNHHHNQSVPGAPPNAAVSTGYTPKVRPRLPFMLSNPSLQLTPPRPRSHSIPSKTPRPPCFPTPYTSSLLATPATAPPVSSSVPPAQTKAAAKPSTGLWASLSGTGTS
jgi:hypothetical protein